MSNEILTTGASGRSIQAEVLADLMQGAIYSTATILPTARIDEPGEGTLTKRYTRHPTLSDASVGEIEEITNSAWSPDQQSVGTNRYGIALEASEMWELGSKQVDGAEIAIQAAMAVRNGIDTRLAATFASFTNEEDEAGNPLQLEDFIAAQYVIENGELWQRGPIVARLAPKQIQDLRDDIRAQTGTTFGSDVFMGQGAGRLDMLGNAWSLNGVNIMSSRNVASANTAADRVGGMYPAGQLGPILYQEKRAPRPAFDTNVRAGTNIIVVSALYAVANLFLDEGVQVISRA